MKNRRFKISIIMMIFGFLCVVWDFNIGTGLHYPHEYKNSTETIGEFQYYNIASNYNAYCDYKMIEGASSEQSGTLQDSQQTSISSVAKVIDKVYYKDLQVDLLNDFIGLALIIIACLSFRKCSRKFSFGAFSALCAFILHGMIVAFPFFLNGIILCYFAFFIGMGYLALLVLTLYFVTLGIFQMCPGVACRDERKWCRMIWYVIAILQVITTFVFWLGSDLPSLYNLGLFLEGINVLMVLLYWKVLFRAIDYLENSYEEVLSTNESEK